jgi:phage protein D
MELHARRRPEFQRRWHQDGGTLGDFLGKAGKQAGIVSVVVAPAFASIARDWWSPSGASFMAVGRRLADELGGVFRIRGDKAVLAERGAGASASGTALPPVVFDCRAGTVESIKGKPFTGGASRTKAKVRWFDRKEGKWKAEEVEVAPVDGAPPSVAHGRYPQADAGRAKGRAKGRKNQAAHDKGQMAVKSDFRDDVSVGAPASIVNARPGVDGAYTVKEATHKAERGGGSSSEFELVRPSGTAGKDTRKKKTTTKTSSGQAEAGAVPASSVA